ncbi:MAG: hypothetical protein P8079_00975 [Gammaproteobacteria bacterium]|jgi:hypothetical protein
MTMRRIRGTLQLAAMMAAMGIIAGCSHTLTGMSWSPGATPPPGYQFSNGMPPSSEGPPPSWYAQRFNRARGLGEAIKRNHRALWERDPGTFAYYVGGRFFAQYQPWEHYLQIRTDHKGVPNVSCHWDANGALSMSEVGGGAAPAGSKATCDQLLDELQKRVAPRILAHSGS